MSSIKVKDLNPKTATDDAKKIISTFMHYCYLHHYESLGDYLLNVFGPKFSDDPTSSYINLLKNALTFKLVKDAITKNNCKKELKELVKRAETASDELINTILNEGVFVQEMINLYSYAAGNETADSYSAQEFRLQLMSILFSSPMSRLENYHSISWESLQRHFPRLAYALRLVDARIEIDTLLEYDGLDKYISPSTLATLAEITYMAVIKKIKAGKIPAKKVEGEWQIPLDFALDWLKKRKKKVR